MASDDKAMAECDPNPTSPTAQELINELRSSFLEVEFKQVATKLTEREARMKENYLELRKKSEAVEKDRDLLILENRKLNDQLISKQKEFDAIRMENLGYIDQINVLNLEKSRVSKNREDELKKKEAELSYYKKHLEDRVLKLEQTAKELMNSGGNCSIDLENKQQNNPSTENSKPPLENNKRTDPKLPHIIQIIDDDDDDDQTCIATLKRKRESDDIKKEYNSDKKNHQEPKASIQDSKPDPVIKKVDDSFRSILAKLKTRKERWESEAEMVKEFEIDDELCMSAICALHRPKNIVLGYDTSRITELAQLINNQYEQRKLKKPVFELNQSVLNECRRFAKKYSVRLFNIYQKKEDPFFPPSRKISFCV